MKPALVNAVATAQDTRANRYPAASMSRRLHLNHGPIDLVIRATGDRDQVRLACAAATRAFEPVLDTLVKELPILRTPVAAQAVTVNGPVARRMCDAVQPWAAHRVSPMAAVAGAVADHILEHMLAFELESCFVNNGGDIALAMAPGHSLTTGLVCQLNPPTTAGTLKLTGPAMNGGIATSGWQGRSFSLGIADAVTVYASTAAAADVAATLIANNVNLEHPNIERAPAVELQHDSDLGERLVTVACGPLDPDSINAALDSGMQCANHCLAAGFIRGATLHLQGHQRTAGHFDQNPNLTTSRQSWQP